MIFRSGDKVQIVGSGEDLERCAGGWNRDMNQYVGDGNTYTIEYRDQASNGSFGYHLRETPWFWDERLLTYYDDNLEPCFKSTCDLTELFSGNVGGEL